MSRATPLPRPRRPDGPRLLPEDSVFVSWFDPTIEHMSRPRHRWTKGAAYSRITVRFARHRGHEGGRLTQLALRGGKPAVSRDLRVRWPVIGAEEREAALQVLDSGALCGSRAPQVRALEDEFARFVGAKFCLATNSGTAALHMAGAAAGIEPGGEGITSALPYPATPPAVPQHNAGARLAGHQSGT